jgi:hypothetical protein
MKPLVYVAGPITGNPFGCVRESMHAFTRLLDLGCTPFMPQWSVIGEMCHPLHYETWLDYDFDIIRHCSALVRLRGESPGADREVEHAIATKWGKWQQTPPRGGGGGEKPTSEAGFTDEIQTENAENGNGLGRIDRDNDNDSDKDIQKPSSGKPDPSLFASFWSAYPRHVAKAAAEKAWAKIVKTIDPLTIVVGAERMAADPNLPAEQFIPHPATWLNQQRWNDPPYPSATGRAPQANTRDAGKLALLQGLRAGA